LLPRSRFSIPTAESRVRAAARPLQWLQSGALQFPGILWASGDSRLLSLRGLVRVKQQKRERISRPQAAPALVKKRTPRAAMVALPQAVDEAVEVVRASEAVDTAPVVIYKATEEVVDAAESAEAATVTVHIIMHNGKRVRATFKRSDTLQQLRDYIEAHTPQKGAVFSLWGGRPRALLASMEQALTAGNVLQALVQQRVPNAVLQAAVRRVMARTRYQQRLETEASVMKLNATESRLRRLTEEMRNHSTIMQETHELEVQEEERQQRLLAIVNEAVAEKKRQARRMSRASASSGSYAKDGSDRVDDGFSGDEWDSDAEAAFDADTEGPQTPAKSSVAVASPAPSPPRVKQLPLSPAALQRLHEQVAGLDLLSPLRRRIYTKMRAGSAGYSAQAVASRSADQMPERVPEQSPRCLQRAAAVSDAERLKRMWKEQRNASQRAPEHLTHLGVQGAAKQFQMPTPHSASTTASPSAAALAHVVPTVPPTEPNERKSALAAADDAAVRFSYRASLKQLRNSEHSKRRLRM
jgi:hypothetical protein